MGMIKDIRLTSDIHFFVREKLNCEESKDKKLHSKF